MNRCAPPLMAALFLLAASTSLVSLPAAAQTNDEVATPKVRTFPKAALRGELVVLSPPIISMDGKADRLSPGSRIRDANNHLVLSGAIVNQKLLVNYLREGNGQVHQVWLLNSEEAKEKRPGASASLFTFDSNTAAPADDGKTPYGQLPAYSR